MHKRTKFGCSDRSSIYITGDLNLKFQIAKTAYHTANGRLYQAVKFSEFQRKSPTKTLPIGS